MNNFTITVNGVNFVVEESNNCGTFILKADNREIYLPCVFCAALDGVNSQEDLDFLLDTLLTEKEQEKYSMEIVQALFYFDYGDPFIEVGFDGCDEEWESIKVFRFREDGTEIHKDWVEKYGRTLINLTPHAITFCDAEGNATLTVEPSGQLARCTTKTVIIGTINGIPVTKTEFGEVEGLPEATENTIFLVSSLVASRVPDRLDVFIPNESVRDDKGRIIGCKSLGRI